MKEGGGAWGAEGEGEGYGKQFAPKVIFSSWSALFPFEQAAKVPLEGESCVNSVEAVFHHVISVSVGSQTGPSANMS